MTIIPGVRAKVTHFTDRGYHINGIIHVGTAEGEEFPYYRDMGIHNLLGIEALPDKAAECRAAHRVRVINTALSDYDGIADFHVTADEGHASSLLPPGGQMSQQCGGVVRTIPVSVARFDTLARAADIDLLQYDTLVIDVQGSELEVLRGFGEDLFLYFKHVQVEASEVPLYDGGAPAAEVVDFMVSGRGYVLDSPIYWHDDIFFVRGDQYRVH